ncbi:MAG: hypothetical protein R3C15_09160 [Thermoleophilia bacterium]
MDALRTARFGRALLLAGLGLTAATGVGLWGWPRDVGPSFAWPIAAPLTAAWMGAWYVTAAVSLLAGFREPRWARTRIVLVVALTLTSTSLIATARFLDEFALGQGATIARLIAWTWLLVYALLPPAVLAVIVAHERRGGRAEWRAISEPLLPATRVLLGALALAGLVSGIWLSAAPGALASHWPWRLGELPASVVGTWLLTLAVGSAWALAERDWARARIALVPAAVGLVLNLVALARFPGELRDGVSIGLYAGALAALLVGLLAVAALQRRAASG